MTAIDRRGQLIGLATAVDYAEGAVISKTLLDKKAGTLTLFSFDAGQGLSEHVSPYDATVLVTDGEATLIIGGKPLQVKAGELVIMPANIPHSVQADTRFKMLLIMIRDEVRAQPV
jgi:quercetin dioxygenase-like cupin family protein